MKLERFFMASLLLFLIACGRDVENNRDTNSSHSEHSEEIEKVELEEENWEDAVGGIDLAEEDFEEIEWDKIHLTKAQFDNFLNEMLNHPMELNEEDENRTVITENKDFIEIDEE